MAVDNKVSATSLIRFLNGDIYDNETGKRCSLLVEKRADGTKCINLRPLTEQEARLDSTFHDVVALLAEEDVVSSDAFASAYCRSVEVYNKDTLLKLQFRFFGEIALHTMSCIPCRKQMEKVASMCLEKRHVLPASRALLASGDIDGALCQASKKEDRIKRSLARSELSGCIARLGKFEKAKMVIEETDDLWSSERVRLLNDIAISQAVSLSKQERYQDAYAELRSTYSYSQGYALSTLFIAVVGRLYDQGLCQQAVSFVESFKQKIAPDDLDAIYKALAELFLREHRFKEAKEQAAKIQNTYYREPLVEKIGYAEAGPRSLVPFEQFLEAIKILPLEILSSNHKNCSSSDTPGRLCELGHYDLLAITLADNKVWVFQTSYTTHGFYRGSLYVPQTVGPKTRPLELTADQHAALMQALYARSPSF